MSHPQETATVGPELPPERSLQAGSVVADRYEVKGHLGRGGHATVYRVYDRLLETEVALKLVHPEHDPERSLARIRREVGVAREGLSPHLVRVFDLGQSQGDIYLTMELLAGGSLRDRLRQGQLPMPEALRIGEALFRGLAVLHAKGAVHRDVKPGNILFSDSGEVKLADFGLVRRLDREETRVTLEAGILGTLGYLSPEQLLGKDVGPRSDLYSAGVVLFEMLAGKPPYDAASELGMLVAPFGRIPGLRKVLPEAPRWLAETVARLLERRPADRFPNAEAVLAVLEKRSVPPRYRLRRRLLRAAGATLLFLLLAGVLVTPVQNEFSHLVPAGETGIAAVSTNGERLWTIEGVAPEIADRAAFARITPGGPRLIAIVLAQREWSREAVSTLSFLDPASGQVVKEVKLPDGTDFFPNDPPRFSFASAKAVDLFDDDGVDEILINFIHVPEAPSYTVLYAPHVDRAQIVFYARGGQGFEDAVDLDGDGSRELLFAGVNNGWNWVNVLAAVRVGPGLDAENWLPVTAAPDLAEQPLKERFLLWYATLPRGYLQTPHSLTIDEKRREITVRYRSGQKWTLGFDGFPPGGSGPDRIERGKARRETYQHVRESDRLRRAGLLDLAMSEARAAYDSAGRAREAWLQQYAERLQARLLVMQGRIPEAEALFTSLVERAEDAPEVAYDAAVAFHLKGDLRRAAAWYEKGIGRGSAIGAGKSKHEFLKGEVLALVEGKHYKEALSAVARFGATYPTWEGHLWIFREYIRWRAGERPLADPSGVASNWPDLERYWELEFALASGGKPGEVLQRVDQYLAERPETRAEVMSLRAELLARLGNRREAAAVAQAALELVRMEQGRSIIAHGHLDLVEERARRLGEELE